MGRRRKPGVPGKTTIPQNAVSSTTERLQALFVKQGFAEDFDLFAIAQQSFLYLEVERHALGCGPECTSVKPSMPRTPLGRLRHVRGDNWELHPYRWSDEDWDDRSPATGTPEELVLTMLVERLWE
jgi:hypothetical protein